LSPCLPISRITPLQPSSATTLAVIPPTHTHTHTHTQSKAHGVFVIESLWSFPFYNFLANPHTEETNEHSHPACQLHQFGLMKGCRSADTFRAFAVTYLHSLKS